MRVTFILGLDFHSKPSISWSQFMWNPERFIWYLDRFSGRKWPWAWTFPGNAFENLQKWILFFWWRWLTRQWSSTWFGKISRTSIWTINGILQSVLPGISQCLWFNKNSQFLHCKWRPRLAWSYGLALIKFLTKVN